MKSLILNKVPRARQYLISIVFIFLVSTICYLLHHAIDYKIVALVLLVCVSLTAMFFDVLPVLLTAFLSAFILDFFFIPPKFTLHIDNSENVLMFFMYFIVALVNAVLTLKIRVTEKAASKKEEKEQTLRLYNTVLNSLSHELRTPIATIIGATDNLQTDNDKLSEANKAELLGEISKASLRLNNQVDNLLSMSRLESGFIQPKKDWCDISELIYGVVNRLKENLGNRKVSISIENPFPLCKLDYGLMEQVLHNLIMNAHLYTRPECTIFITAEFQKGKLILIVEDNGSGFPEHEMGKVFDKFYRLRTAQTGGTGLGLSIVKGYVEAHHGLVKLQNNQDGGAEFTIEIPTESASLSAIKHE